jgi:hypothetical protein
MNQALAPPFGYLVFLPEGSAAQMEGGEKVCYTILY